MAAILFIDPGTRKTGWAKFISDGETAWFSSAGTIVQPRGLGWIERLDAIVKDVMHSVLVEKKVKVYRWNIRQVVIELPRPFTSSRGTAASNTGSTLKIMAIVFALRQSLLERGYAVELIRVDRWKGQVKKYITARRVCRHWGVEISEKEELEGSDRCDACGIGDWWFRKPKGPGYGVKVVKRGS
jgi:Holliday junction resolvasome RuvABC endonuclease subunit